MAFAGVLGHDSDAGGVLVAAAVPPLWGAVRSAQGHTHPGQQVKLVSACMYSIVHVQSINVHNKLMLSFL